MRSILKEHSLMTLALAVIVVVIAVYWQTFFRIIGMWSIQDYQYGWLVYPVSLYVLWTKKEVLAQSPWSASKTGLFLTAVLVFGWLVSRAVGVQILEFAVATMLITAAFWALAGAAAARKAAFPLLLLLTAVPMGGFLVEPLMKSTAEIASILLMLTGVPAMRDGQFFYLPGGSFEVANICSGLRYLLAGSMASLAYTYVTYTKISKRLLFIGISAIVLVITNGVRAFIVMSVASATDMKVLGGQDHVIFGMILFAVVFMAMIWIGEAYADPRPEIETRTGEPVAPSMSASFVVFAIATLGVLLAGPVFSSAMLDRGAPAISDLALPTLEDCGVAQVDAAAEYPRFVNSDYLARGRFSCDDFNFSVYVASYASQEQGKELISWHNRVWSYELRRIVEQAAVIIEADVGPTTVQQVLVKDPAGWQLTWYWYQVGETVSSSEYGVKALEAIRTLSMRPAESSVVVITAMSGDVDNSSELQQQIESRAQKLMRWNLERVRLGGQK